MGSKNDFELIFKTLNYRVTIQKDLDKILEEFSKKTKEKEIEIEIPQEYTRDSSLKFTVKISEHKLSETIEELDNRLYVNSARLNEFYNLENKATIPIVHHRIEKTKEGTYRIILLLENQKDNSTLRISVFDLLKKNFKTFSPFFYISGKTFDNLGELTQAYVSVYNFKIFLDVLRKMHKNTKNPLGTQMKPEQVLIQKLNQIEKVYLNEEVIKQEGNTKIRVILGNKSLVNTREVNDRIIRDGKVPSNVFYKKITEDTNKKFGLLFDLLYLLTRLDLSKKGYNETIPYALTLLMTQIFKVWPGSFPNNAVEVYQTFRLKYWLGDIIQLLKPESKNLNQLTEIANGFQYQKTMWPKGYKLEEFIDLEDLKKEMLEIYYEDVEMDKITDSPLWFESLQTKMKY